MLENAPKQEYSRQYVRRTLGISGQRLRGWERQGLIPACDSYSFSDLIALRTLQKLRQNRIPTRRIGRALASLKHKLSDVQHPLSELKIACDGRRITVHIAGQKMEAISGQMLFNFETAELGSVKTFPPEKPSNRLDLEKKAELWFQRGLELEERNAPVEEAIAAYRKAVELNPAAAGALVNLGTLYYRERRFSEAEDHYLKAIAADPRYPLAHFNLGNLYDEEGQLDKAQQYYNSALHLSSTYADAHFNLALLCERMGDGMKAVHHWKAYLKLDSASSWAAIARRQLEKLRDQTLVKSR